MRWARNVRDRRRAQYFGLIVTFGLAWGIVAVLAAPLAWWTWAALAVIAVLRVAAAVAAARLCGARGVGGKFRRERNRVAWTEVSSARWEAGAEVNPACNAQ